MPPLQRAFGDTCDSARKLSHFAAHPHVDIRLRGRVWLGYPRYPTPISLITQVIKILF